MPQCLPKDREWSADLKELCNNCNNLDLPCGPSVRSNAKVESGPRKLASKNILEVSGAASHKSASRSNISTNDSHFLPELNPADSRAQAVTSTQIPGRQALPQATALENQNPDVEMVLQTNSTFSLPISGLKLISSRAGGRL